MSLLSHLLLYYIGLYKVIPLAQAMFHLGVQYGLFLELNKHQIFLIYVLNCDNSIELYWVSYCYPLNDSKTFRKVLTAICFCINSMTSIHVTSHILEHLVLKLSFEKIILIISSHHLFNSDCLSGRSYRIAVVLLSLTVTTSLSDVEAPILPLLLLINRFLVLVTFFRFVVTDGCIPLLSIADIFMMSSPGRTSFLQPSNVFCLGLPGKVRFGSWSGMASILSLVSRFWFEKRLHSLFSLLRLFKATFYV